MNKIDGMSHQQSSFALQLVQDYVHEDLLSDVCIQCRNWIVHQKDVSGCVDCSSESDSCFLSSTEVDTFFTDFCLVTCRKNLEVTLKLAKSYSVDVSLLVEWKPIQNVVTNSFILNPRTLLNVSKFTVNLYGWINQPICTIDQILLEMFDLLLVLDHFVKTVHCTILLDLLWFNIKHLTNKSLQKTALSSSNISNNNDQFTLADL